MERIMKSCTDLEQGKILAKIITIESADMYYWCGEDLRIGGHRAMDIEFDIPCWSLAALLNVLPHIQEFYPTIERINDKYVCRYKNSGIWTNGANSVDACYAMILKLHGLNLL